MGLSSSKSKTTTNEQRNENVTQTPILPDYADPTFDSYVGRVNAFGQGDPYQYVAGPSPAHEMAWGNVGNLSDWQPQMRLASEMAQRSGNASPSLAGPAALMTPAQGSAPTHRRLAAAEPGRRAGPALHRGGRRRKHLHHVEA